MVSNTYFNKRNTKTKKITDKKFNFSKKTMLKIDKQLKKNAHSIDAYKLIRFIKESIKMREYSKFVFSKSINEIFQNLKNFIQKN